MHNIILVTGASRGIGASTAIHLASMGYAVVINYCTQRESAQQVATLIKDQGGTAWTFQADVSQATEVDNLFRYIHSLSGQLVGLVNNAGRLQPQMQLVDMPNERVLRTLQDNLMSQFYCCQAAIKIMSTHYNGAGGAIVNVSSAAARLGAPNEYIDYAMAKGAVDTLTVGLAKETASQGIRVNGVRPGVIDTQMHADGGEPQRLQRIAPSVPLQRGGQPDEVAKAIGWLISVQASYTTGSFIEVTGGR